MHREAKIYNDGSHFLAIPHTEKPSVKRRQEVEEEAMIYDDNKEKTNESSDEDILSNDVCSTTETIVDNDILEDKTDVNESIGQKPKYAGETKSQIFNRLYDESRSMKMKQRQAFLIREMRKYFKTEAYCKEYVFKHLERKRINLINRRIRFARKANLNEFNYFVTFTRNDAIMTELDFRKKLSKCLRNYHTNHGWTYMGVWERSPTGRLHFHALMNIPEGTMPGKLISVEDYGFRTHKMKKTVQNTFFNNRFGRSDFEAVPHSVRAKNMAVRYISKYLEKTGEKIVYSRGVPMYVISDIEEKDIMARINGEYGEKFVLHDKFSCWDEGCYVGDMCPEVKKQLRTANS